MRIQWDTGSTNSYRMGKEGKYDLKLAGPPPVPESSEEEEEDMKGAKAELLFLLFTFYLVVIVATTRFWGHLAPRQQHIAVFISVSFGGASLAALCNCQCNCPLSICFLFCHFRFGNLINSHSSTVECS